MVLFLGIGPPFVNPGDCPSGQHLDSHKEGASLQWSASIPLGGVTSPRGVVPVGLGDVVGHCHDVANLPGKWHFLSLLYLFWCENFTLFFKGKVSYVCVLLNMLAAKREPTPCYRDAYSVDTTVDILPG